MQYFCAGMYTYPFEFSLPEDAPASLEWEQGDFKNESNIGLNGRCCGAPGEGVVGLQGRVLWGSRGRVLWGSWAVVLLLSLQWFDESTSALFAQGLAIQIQPVLAVQELLSCCA